MEHVAYGVVMAGVTETGPVRKENQDAIAINGKCCLKSSSRLSERCVSGEPCVAAVIDGMGGHAGGADAAALAACAMARMNAEDLKDVNGYLSALSRRMSYAGGAWQTPDMGAALALLAVLPGYAVIANVGDCRVYRLDEWGCLGQWSKDDRSSKTSSALSQALGAGAVQIDAHLHYFEGREAQGRYILCSDGVWETLGDDRISTLCAARIAPEQLVDGIASACYAGGATDNCSIVCIDVTCIS